MQARGRAPVVSAQNRKRWSIAGDARASLANNSRGTLFISLHANAAASAGPSGAEVFSLAREGYAAEAQGIAAPAASLPVFGGGSRSIEIIAWDTAQMQRLPESERFSRLVHDALAAGVPMNPHALGKAPFRVLIGANMPAVLIEIGFGTNAAEARFIGESAGQDASWQGFHVVTDQLAQLPPGRVFDNLQDAWAQLGGGTEQTRF